MTGRVLWVGALALTLSVLALYSARRLREIEAVTASRVGAGLAPAVDSTSPSGYRWGTHRLVLPETDGYLWLLQAEESLASGALRVREARYDNAPLGREVHWAGFERWWVLGLTALHQLAHPELTAPRSLERVAPWANTALLAGFLLVFTPLVAAGLGPAPAAVLAIGCVAVFPFFEEARVGYFDHHAAATLSCLACVLLLVLGGAGWVRDDHAPRSWLPTARGARGWFIASGLAAGAGLWISAATMVPVLVGVGLGALVGLGVAARGAAGPGARLEPSLFRVWGFAGAAASLGLYLLEYFPDHLGMRLEVNHPLYALAIIGGGDLIARAGPLLAGAGSGSPGRRTSARAWIVADLALVLQLLAVVLATRAATFRVADPVLWLFHNRYIYEFLGLAQLVAPLSPAQVIGRVSLVVLVALPIAALLWPSALAAGWRIAWRALLVVLIAAAAAYAYVFFVGLTGGSRVGGVVGAAVAVALWFLLPLSARASAVAPPWRSALVLAALPALVMLLLSLAQSRWLGIAGALWLAATVVATAAVLATIHPLLRGAGHRAALGALALPVLVIAPAFALREPYSPPNAMVISRDASLWLRRRVGADSAVILAGPSATANMIWFGGFRGLGTLYWENLEGLKASAEICGAPDAASARAALARRGVTHVAAYAWDGGLAQLRLSADAAGSANWPRAAGLQPMCSHQPGDLPAWLVPLPYVPPRVAGYEHPVVRLFEVGDSMPPELAWARLARYYQALEDRRMREALDRSLEVGPTVAGLALLAQLQNAGGDRAAFLATVERLRSALGRGGAVDPVDRIEAALALALARDGPGASRELAAALAEADERALRRLSPERLGLVVDLSRQLGLDRVHPEPVVLAARLMREG